MGIAYDTWAKIRHRETLESGEDFEEVVKDGVEYVVVLEDFIGSDEKKVVSIWRKMTEEDESMHDQGYKLQFVDTGEPGVISWVFETFSDGDFSDADLPEEV